MKRYLFSLGYLISLHVGGLIVFSLFRLFLFIENYSSLQPESSGKPILQSIAFTRGIWFDNVTACYILLLPLIVVTVCGLFNYYGKRLYRFITGYLACCYLAAFAISAANLPYFHYFFKNINSSVLNWLDYGSTTLGMMTQELSYWLAMLGFFVIAAAYLFTLRKKMYSFMDKLRQIRTREMALIRVSV
ncbi:MAG: hypothetical protein RR346_07240, partial [Bacteroidales bacterium]